MFLIYKLINNSWIAQPLYAEGLSSLRNMINHYDLKQVRNNYKKALLIPQKATFEVLDKKFVFVIDKDNTVKQREITVAEEEIPYLFIVKNGLSVGDKILLDGLRKVKNGQKIHIDYQAPNKVFSNLNLYAE